MENKIKTSVQYQVTNVLLFDHVFHNWYMFNQILTMGKDMTKKFLYTEWNRIKDILIKEDRTILSDADKEVTVDDFDAYALKSSVGPIYFFSFPDYEETDAASKYVALALTFGTPRYFTLEYSYNILENKPSWVIGEFFIKDNSKRHNNYGSIDNMELENFQKQVIDILEKTERTK